MKTRIIAALLAVLILFSLTACGEQEAISVLEQAAEEAGVNLDELSGKDTDTPAEIPQCVKDLSEEEDILLNGELKDGAYNNKYFGYKFTVPEGGTLTRLNDEVTESTEIYPLSRAYEQEQGGLLFWADIPNIDGYLYIIVSAMNEDEVGLSEEELVKKHIEDVWEINKAFDEDNGPSLGTAVIAGEKHPISIQVSQTNTGEQFFIGFTIPKGNFRYDVTISVTNGDYQPLLDLFERI